MFPCWDEPIFKATFNLSIKHLTEHIVLSNIPGKQITYLQEHLSHKIFEKTPIIPSSAITIVVSTFLFTSSERINFQCRNQATSYLRYAKMIIKNVTLYMKSQWMRCKEFVKVDHIAIPGFFQDRINEWNLVFYRYCMIRKIFSVNYITDFIRKENIISLYF